MGEDEGDRRENRLSSLSKRPKNKAMRKDNVEKRVATRRAKGTFKILPRNISKMVLVYDPAVIKMFHENMRRWEFDNEIPSGRYAQEQKAKFSKLLQDHGLMCEKNNVLACVNSRPGSKGCCMSSHGWIKNTTLVGIGVFACNGDENGRNLAQMQGEPFKKPCDVMMMCKPCAQRFVAVYGNKKLCCANCADTMERECTQPGINDLVRRVCSAFLAEKDELRKVFMASSLFRMWEVLLDAKRLRIAPEGLASMIELPSFQSSWKVVQDVLGLDITAAQAMQQQGASPLHAKVPRYHVFDEGELRVNFVRFLPLLHALKQNSLEQSSLSYQSVIQVERCNLEKERQKLIIREMIEMKPMTDNAGLCVPTQSHFYGKRPFDPADTSLEMASKKGNIYALAVY
jgi:hypothetical protein